ncbi:MAG: protoporphyrinogen oxidase [Myxococcales bacterium]|nr:protoporphyrinogen oxidase [Myxococcales bacterium]
MITCDLAVIGGGIAGLAAAWRGRELGLRTVIFEAARTLGGKMRSERRDGYLIEYGPSSFLGSAAPLWHLINGCGLADAVVQAQKPNHRYIYRERSARRLPTGPLSLLTGDYLSMAGKLRLLAEPLVLGHAQSTDTAWTFAKRRLGEEAARYLLTPFVSGVYAGDVERLGAKDAFPKLWNWERRGGSMVIGALTTPADSPTVNGPVPRRGTFSLRDGLGSLPRAVVAALPKDIVRFSSPVESIERTATGWLVRPHAHLATDKRSVVARNVVVALPAHSAAELLAQVCPSVARTLAQVVSVRVAVVHFGGPDPQGVAPRGFGVLIPPGEGLRTLGILFPSSIFAGRAPTGHYLHTGFLGGANDPEAADLSDESLVAHVVRARANAFPKVAAQLLEPTFFDVVRWREAIPQYLVGHRDRMTAALSLLSSQCPGLALAGSYVAGVSMADSAGSGANAVEIALSATAEASPTEARGGPI